MDRDDAFQLCVVNEHVAIRWDSGPDVILEGEVEVGKFDVILN